MDLLAKMLSFNASSETKEANKEGSGGQKKDNNQKGSEKLEPEKTGSEASNPSLGAPGIPPQEDKSKDGSQMSGVTFIQLPTEVQNCLFYHGIIPRVDAELSLQNVGDYLLRRAEPKEIAVGQYLIISVKTEGSFVHVPLSQDKEDGKFYFMPTVKDNAILEVINSHLSQNQPIYAESNAYLRKAILRSTWIVPHEDVILYRKIGAGAFGEVFLGRMVNPTSEYVLDIAVKKLKQEATIEAKLRFMKEARMMRKNYRHKHVVMIFGIATLYSPLLILMELCPNGSLISHLRKNKGKVTVLDKLRFTAESSSGLAYLEKMNCIHRDVAARNCLLSAKNEIKISDFGLADDKGMVIDHSLDKLPIKWLAPETMQDKIYSLKSDIWAFGIMIWEIFADGEEPYPGLNNVQARAKIVVLNYRMKFPDETPQEVVQVISTCWNKNPDARQTMGVHSTALQQIYETKMPILLAQIAQQEQQQQQMLQQQNQNPDQLASAPPISGAQSSGVATSSTPITTPLDASLRAPLPSTQSDNANG